MGALLKGAEVAAVAGMTERSVRRRACELRVKKAKEAAGNGRRPRVYQLESLSPKLQRAWLAQQQTSTEVQQPAESHLELALTSPGGASLSVEDEAEALRKYRIIESIVAPEKFRFLWLQNNCKKSQLIDSLAEQHQVGRRTIHTWLKDWKEQGLPGLARKDRTDKGFSRSLNRAGLDFLLAAALPRSGVYGELSVREIYRAYQEERSWRAAHAQRRLNEIELQHYARYVDPETGKLSASAQLPEASYETFRFWYGRLPEAVKTFARQGEETFHNKEEILSFRDISQIQPMDYLVLDHRLLDIVCLVKPPRGEWELVRPWLTAALDFRTRKWIAWSIVETPSSDSIASVLKRAFLDYGLWKATYVDNGKDFRSEYLEGKRRRNGQAYKVETLGDGMRGVMETLGVRVHHAIVKRARSKIIEPNFINVANFDRTLPWYCGHKPTARPERFDKLVEQHERWLKGEAKETPFKTIEEIAALYGEFIESLGERPHTGEGMRKPTATGYGWMTPQECWEKLIGGVEVRRAPAEVLKFCFLKRKKLKVRNAELRPSFNGRQFHYRLAENPLGLVMLNGREVEFAYDPHDLGTAAIYCDGRFLGLAKNVELRRMGEEGFVADERDRRRARREVKNFIKGVHGAVYVPGPEERAVRRQAVRPARLVAAGENSIPADLPGEIVQASEAAAREREFKFADAPGVDLVALDDEAYHDDKDDEFQFFGRANE